MAGITHFEDLSLGGLLEVLVNLDNYSISEKVDGSQLIFGEDNHGFYTSRETKGGPRVYDADDYLSAAPPYMAIAHRVLEKALPKLRKNGFVTGMMIEVEVLTSGLPNVIPYDDKFNHIVFLRYIHSIVDPEIPLGNLIKNISNIVIKDVDVSRSHDGMTFVKSKEIQKWKIVRVPQIIDKSLMEKVQEEIAPHVHELIDYLDTVDMDLAKTYRSVLSPGNADHFNRTVGHIKAGKRFVLRELIKPKILEIKEILLDRLVRPRASLFGPPVSKGGWIEGLVLVSPDSLFVSTRVLKLVDKQRFLTIKDFCWDIRSKIITTAKSEKYPGGIIGQLKLSLGRSINYTKLGTAGYRQYLSSFGGPSVASNILAISDTVPYHQTQNQWLQILKDREVELLAFLDKYQQDKSTYRLEVPRFDKIEIITYDGEIDSRTLDIFARTFVLFDRLRNRIECSADSEELVRALVEGPL